MSKFDVPRIMKTILCKIRGHNYITVKKDNIFLEKVECKNCKEKFAIDGYGRIVKLTPYWVENYIFFKRYFQKQAI